MNVSDVESQMWMRRSGDEWEIEVILIFDAHGWNLSKHYLIITLSDI